MLVSVRNLDSGGKVVKVSNKNISMKISIIGMFLGLYFPLSAMAQMAPPVKPPQSLPPIPGQTPNQANHTPEQIPVPKPKPTNNSTINNQDNNIQNNNYDFQTVYKMLELEANRLNKALEGKFHVVVLNTNSDSYKQYVAGGLLKRSVDDYQKEEHGLSGLMIMGGKLNNQTKNICYVLIEPEKPSFRYIANNFIAPVTKVSHEQTGAAFLVGHEVGHCYDEYERAMQMSRKSIWDLNQAGNIGISSSAASATFGGNFSTQDFNAKATQLFRYPSQQQYRERVADSFASLWIMKLGANEEALNILLNERNKSNPSTPHFTTPAIKSVMDRYREISGMQRIDLIWSLARDIQRKTGISNEAIALDNNNNTIDENAVIAQMLNQELKMVVTPNGPQVVDENGKIVKTKGKNTTVIGKPRNFNDLPRFGE